MAKRPDKKRKKKRGLFAKKSRRPRTKRPRPQPIDEEEEMLAEFSDDTNEFYVDEVQERRASGRRNDRRKSDVKKPKKPKKEKKPLSPTQRKLIRILSYGAIISIVLIVGVVLSLTVLFKTQAYEVSGNTKYTEEEIIEASGISKGENIFLAPKGPAENRIKKQFPYVEEADVGFKIPDSIRISIVEAVEGYLVKVSDGNYLVISTKGRILNQIDDASQYNLPIFIGPKLESGTVGDYVSYEDETVLSMIESITQTFADNGYQGITEIDATNTADISFTYDGRIKVKLGIPEDLDYKVRTAMTIITQNLDKNGSAQGVLDVSRCNSTKRSYFNEQQIKPTEAVKPTTAPTEAVDNGGNTGDYSGYDDSYNYYDYGNYGDYGVYQDDYSWYAADGGYVDYGVY